ncbi:MAG: GTP-binding protein [Candidatus Hodarchaeales archaeon]
MVTVTSKIVVIGDGMVGKTTFVKSFLGGDVLEGYKPTIGVDIGRKAFMVEKEGQQHEIIYQIWDLSGQDSFQAIRKQFYSRCDGGIVIYDVTRPETFNNVPNWVEELFEQTGPIPIVLVANKIDLLSDKTDDFVKTEEGQQLASTLSLQSGLQTAFVEASALYRKNNLKPFIELGLTILAKNGI